MHRTKIAYDCALIFESYRVEATTSECAAITETSHYICTGQESYYVTFMLSHERGISLHLLLTEQNK